MFGLSKWRPWHLLVGWCAYWLALLLVYFGPGIPILWRLTRPDAKGSASASFGNGAFSFVLTEGAVEVWTRHVGYLPALLAIGLPPLALWALWLRAQRRRAPDAEHVA